jgi:hypothetical protein
MVGFPRARAHCASINYVTVCALPNKGRHFERGKLRPCLARGKFRDADGAFCAGAVPAALVRRQPPGGCRLALLALQPHWSCGAAGEAMAPAARRPALHAMTEAVNGHERTTSQRPPLLRLAPCVVL